MKALILNGTTCNDRTIAQVENVIVGRLRSAGWNVASILLKEQKIASCRGCFGCWTRSPGVCVIDDAGRRVAEAAMQCDLMVWLTPVTFGGYSSELKKALDRLIPNLLPYFMLINGEIHHVPRYRKYPDLAIVGVAQEHDVEAEKTFVRLANRNAINNYCLAHSAGVIFPDDEPHSIETKVIKLLKTARVNT